MRQIELKLIPAPGAKPELLALMEPVNSDHPVVTQIWSNLPNEIILEAYTRDAWAADTSTHWQSIQIKSVDGRQKLPGFTKYLRDRQKTAYGRVPPTATSDCCYMWVISPKQASSTTLMCRVAPLSKIPQCPHPSLSHPARGGAGSNTATTTAPSANSNVNAKPTTAPVTKRKKAGLLGSLVGAQKRTNQHLIDAAPTRRDPPVVNHTANTSATPTTTSNAAAAGGAPPSSSAAAAAPPVDLKTAGQLLADFRQEMEEKMLDFDISPETVLKVNIDVAAKVRTLIPADKQSGRVTMEILKYIVYEQAEEVNEEWIAHKEPTEFMDEAVIAIYKEGEAPPEVLEELNKGELPDEVRGQERALQEQRAKQHQQRAQKMDAEQQKAALRSADDPDDMAVLNAVKRDRRTIEEIQRDDNKRQRME